MADEEPSRRTHPPPCEERLAAAAAREDLRPWEVVRDRESLKEFAHDAVVEALDVQREHPGAFDGPGKLEAFIRRVAHRFALKDVRKREQRAEALAGAYAQLDAQRRAVHERMNPIAPLLERELRLEITRILKGMRPHLSQAWRLHARGDITTEAAAALMGVKTETYLRYVVTANRILRDALRHYRNRGLDRKESIPPAVPVRTGSTDEPGPARDQETLQ